MDIQLLNRWFNKGYSSREMATFYLISELRTASKYDMTQPQQLEQRWAELHEEVCKLVYTK